jgi:HEPN domain-containing protein
MAGSGFILEQIRSAIQQSRICVADLTGSNPNVLYEVGYAQAIRKPIVLLAGEGAQLPFDIAHQRVIMYGDDVESTRERLSGAVAVALSDERLEEAARLFELGQYRATIAAASVVLEHKLRQLLSKRIPGDSSRMGLGQLLKATQRPRLLTESLRKALTEVVSLRNRAVHSLDQPTRKDAQFVLTNVRRVLDDVEQAGKPR